MSWNNEITLISYVNTELDELHQPIMREQRTDVLCQIRSVSRSEFYQASQSHLRPNIVFIIHAFEYCNETLVEHEGDKYKILKTYLLSNDLLELTCEVMLDGC